MSFSVSSNAFSNNEVIPKQYTGEGKDISPPLMWQDVPEGTKELVLICDDPDAPRPQPWVHWVMYKLSPEVSSLPEGLPDTEAMERPVKAVQGINSWDNLGYGGPMPPEGHGVHHYNFHLYALSQALDLEPGATKEEVQAAMKGNILGEATLTGLYERE